MNPDNIQALQELLRNYEKQLQEWQARKATFGDPTPAFIEDEVLSLTRRIEDLRAHLSAAGVSTPDPAAATLINTGGGANIAGNVHLGSGDFVGRDKRIYGDSIYGDKIAGDRITVGDISGSTGVAIGSGARSTVNAGAIPGDAGVARDQFAHLLQELRSAIAAANLDSDEKEAALADLDKVNEQLAKPEPKLSLIRRGLNNAKEIVEGAVGLGAATAVLSSRAQRALEMAQQLFR